MSPSAWEPLNQWKSAKPSFHSYAPSVNHRTAGGGLPKRTRGRLCSCPVKRASRQNRLGGEQPGHGAMQSVDQGRAAFTAERLWPQCDLDLAVGNFQPAVRSPHTAPETPFTPKRSSGAPSPVSRLQTHVGVGLAALEGMFGGRPGAQEILVASLLRYTQHYAVRADCSACAGD